MIVVPWLVSTANFLQALLEESSNKDWGKLAVERCTIDLYGRLNPTKAFLD